MCPIKLREWIYPTTTTCNPCPQSHIYQFSTPLTPFLYPLFSLQLPNPLDAVKRDIKGANVVGSFKDKEETNSLRWVFYKALFSVICLALPPTITNNELTKHIIWAFFGSNINQSILKPNWTKKQLWMLKKLRALLLWLWKQIWNKGEFLSSNLSDTTL